MIRTQIYLTKEERTALNFIAKQTTKTQSELIREAIDNFLEHFQRHRDRKAVLRQAKGLWKKRKDLPDVRNLRREFARNHTEKNEDK